MRTHLWPFLLSLFILPVGSMAQTATSPQLAKVNGFAGVVSGGTNTVVFRDLDTFRKCLSVSGNLCVPEKKMFFEFQKVVPEIANNVTLDGKGLLSIVCNGYCIRLDKGNNIVRNVRFMGPGPTKTLWPEAKKFSDANCTDPTLAQHVLGCAVPVYILEAKKVLIEHNDFLKCGDKCIAIDGGDEITIRNNKFSNSFMGILALGRDPDGSAYGRLTVAYNVFHSVFRRSARVSGAYAMHEFGNLFNGPCLKLPGAFGPSSVGGAQALVEFNRALPGSCNAFQIGDYKNEKTKVYLPAGLMLSRHNIGMADCVKATPATGDKAAVEGKKDCEDKISLTIPYIYQYNEWQKSPNIMMQQVARTAGVQ
jgi:pectate lyase